MRSNSNKRPTIVFKAHSPYTTLIAAIIGELYYKDAKKILLTNYIINESLQERILKSGFFDESYRFIETETSIYGVEQQVDAFLERYPDIDIFFMCVFSDRFGNLLAHRLCGQAKLCIFPEGASCIDLRGVIEFAFKYRYGKYDYIRDFYQIYPIQLEMFDEIWLYSEDIPHDGIAAQFRKIELNRLVEDQTYVVDKLNILFNFLDLEWCDYDIFFLDNYLSEEDRMELRTEIQVLQEIFCGFSGKKIMIKSHPGQDKMFEMMKFSKATDSGFAIFCDSEVPWELIYCNAVIRNSAKKITVILLQMDSSTLSMMNITQKKHAINILFLGGIIKPYVIDMMKQSFTMKERYLISAIGERGNIDLFYPKNLEQLHIDCERIVGISNFGRENTPKYDAECVSMDQFRRTGNLFTKSYLHEEVRDQLYSAYFEFLDEVSQVIFLINDTVDLNKMRWWPSKANLFASFDTTKVYVEGADSERKLIYQSDSGDPTNAPRTHLDSNGCTCFHIQYHGYCKKLIIHARLHVRETYVPLAQLYSDMKWRAEFWEGWNDIQREHKLQSFVETNEIKNVWIFGDAKIGKVLKEGLEAANVNITYIASKGKVLHTHKVYGLDEIPENNGIPDFIIITPMYDYVSIYHSLPIHLRERVLSLREFISRVL